MTLDSKSFHQLKICGESVLNWKKAYNHESQFENGQEMIKCEGSYLPLQEVMKRVYDRSKNKISSDWRYDLNGFTNTSYVKFKKLTPTKLHENAQGLHYLVIKTKQAALFGMSRHCYMELIDDRGNGYSFGLCGPTRYPLVGTKGAIVSPDPKEATPGIERRTKIIISAEKFKEILDRVNQDKESGHEYFHITQHNCSRYVGVICEEHLNLNINNKEFLTQAVTRFFLRIFGSTPSSRFLKTIGVIGAVFRFAISPLFVIFWLITGAPFDDRQGAEAKLRQFGPSNLSLKEKFIKVLYDSVYCNYLKINTGWKLSVWQDKAISAHGTNELTLEEAQSIQLDGFVSMA
jgi:hypothetical protein